MSNKDFERQEGDLKIGDWFKSKWRSENKFFHYVKICEITETGYIDSENKWHHEFEDVVFRAVFNPTQKLT